MTTRPLDFTCDAPHPDQPGVLCVGPPAHPPTTMHGNGDYRWWDGAQPDAGTDHEGAGVASPELGWLDRYRTGQVAVYLVGSATHSTPLVGTLAAVMVEPDPDGVLQPTSLVVTYSGGESLVPWHAVSRVHSGDRASS